jgi:hypothetical protein
MAVTAIIMGGEPTPTTAGLERLIADSEARILALSTTVEEFQFYLDVQGDDLLVSKREKRDTRRALTFASKIALDIAQAEERRHKRLVCELAEMVRDEVNQDG